MRAFDVRLREVKLTAFLLIGVTTLLVTLGSLSRPTHAEGLLPTVRCVVQSLLVAPCQSPITPSQTPPNPSTPAPAPAQASSAQPSNSSAAVQQSAPSSQSTPPQAQSFNAAAPLAVDAKSPLTNVPKTLTPSYNNPKAYDYVAYFNTSSPYASPHVEGDANAFIRPSEQGWRVAGMVWYWWIGIIGAIILSIHLLTKSKAVNRFTAKLLSLKNRP